MQKHEVMILGGGMVGAAMAMDLARTPGFAVTVVDSRIDVLQRIGERYGVKTLRADLSTPAKVREVVAKADLVVGALSSTLGLQTLQAVIEAGRNYVDISFMAEDARVHDALAKQKGVCAVVDCGVAPGLSNLLAGHAARVLKPCKSIEILVGGLPAVRRWPFEYQAGFAPHDVIEEYVRPSRLVENGHVVVKEALSEPELVDFPGVGTLEAFNTDGLRSLTDTLDVPNMREKTMRYPGHIELMRVLRHMGLFNKEPIDVAGHQVRPLDVTAALMFPCWQFAEGEADLTVMRVRGEGTYNGKPTRLVWDLLDRLDPVTGFRSMSRTTGFAATAMAALMRQGKFTRPGVHPPELLANEPGFVDAFLDELRQRGVVVHYREEAL